MATLDGNTPPTEPSRLRSLFPVPSRSRRRAVAFGALVILGQAGALVDRPSSGGLGPVEAITHVNADTVLQATAEAPPTSSPASQSVDVAEFDSSAGWTVTHGDGAITRTA